jgi:hypothetical protein
LQAAGGDNFKKQLEAAYDADAERRGLTVDRDAWKLELREKFARQVKSRGFKSVLEIGSGQALMLQQSCRW